MANEPEDDRRGPHQVTPAEREAQKNPANQQDTTKPAPGRDEPPADTAEQRKRGPESPWMGGG